MALVGIIGPRRRANIHAVLIALEKKALIIDCANIADPHMCAKHCDEQALHDTYALIAESIYRFRDSLLQIPEIKKNYPVKTVVITAPDRLFNYQNKRENEDIYQHAWEIMHTLGKQDDIFVVVTPRHVDLAQKYCTTMVEA